MVINAQLAKLKQRIEDIEKTKSDSRPVLPHPQELEHLMLQLSSSDVKRAPLHI